MSEEPQDLAALDDPAFLAERRRAREELEALTERCSDLTTSSSAGACRMGTGELGE